MIRTALDSDDLTVFTYPADFYLTYSDLVPDPQAFEASHPGHQVVYIDRGLGDPGVKATIADVETGALQPGDLPAWLDTRANAGAQFLTVYANRSNHPAAAAAAGHRAVWWWIATLDGTIAVPDWTPLTGPALVQIAGSDRLGVHADFSLVLNPHWHPSPPPAETTALRGALAAVDHQLATVVLTLASAQGILRLYT